MIEKNLYNVEIYIGTRMEEVDRPGDREKKKERETYKGRERERKHE